MTQCACSVLVVSLKTTVEKTRNDTRNAQMGAQRACCMKEFFVRELSAIKGFFSQIVLFMFVVSLCNYFCVFSVNYCRHKNRKTERLIR
jgi:hypothetical protein